MSAQDQTYKIYHSHTIYIDLLMDITKVTGIKKKITKKNSDINIKYSSATYDQWQKTIKISHLWFKLKTHNLTWILYLGLTKIKDNNLAQKLLDKTMKMNKEIGIQAVATTAVLGLLPELFNK